METETIINEYNNGSSLNEIARKHSTYATSVRRILEKNGVELRHDVLKKGELTITGGEKLIEWAKAQGRLVTKAELAKVAGTKKLSPSYFVKYPELGQYIQPRDQKETQYYSRTLYAWLQQNGIQYKPNDRTTLGVSVSALLFGEYEGIALQVKIKPKYVSRAFFKESIDKKCDRAREKDIMLVCLDEKHFKDLNVIKPLLYKLKHKEK